MSGGKSQKQFLAINVNISENFDNSLKIENKYSNELKYSMVCDYWGIHSYLHILLFAIDIFPGNQCSSFPYTSLIIAIVQIVIMKPQSPIPI